MTTPHSFDGQLKSANRADGFDQHADCLLIPIQIVGRFAPKLRAGIDSDGNACTQSGRGVHRHRHDFCRKVADLLVERLELFMCLGGAGLNTYPIQLIAKPLLTRRANYVSDTFPHQRKSDITPFVIVLGTRL
jgi:hypothetical protein